MKKISVNDKTQIKQLLYMGSVFAIRDDQYRSFGGCQLWWYDKPFDVCRSCQSYWSDARKQVRNCSLDRAARILWHNRVALFVRHKQLHEDRRLAIVGHSENLGRRKGA